MVKNDTKIFVHFGLDNVFVPQKAFYMAENLIGYKRYTEDSLSNKKFHNLTQISNLYYVSLKKPTIPASISDESIHPRQPLVKYLFL